MSEIDEDEDDRTRVRPSVPSPPATPEPRTQRIEPPVAPEADHGNGLPVGTRLGEFEIVSVLGEGGFGIVYLALDQSLERQVALKEYMPSSLAARTAASLVQVKSERYRETFDAGLKSFINEARLLAQFDHPALVKVYRFWEDNGTAYMVMPYYEGITLKALLRSMPEPPDETWLRDMLTPLTGALSVIHGEQCFHRDIAPDNVMMLGGSHDRPLLLDFGAARKVIGDMTQALTVILKPGYAPVEQYAEIPGMKQGAWTDVYALAAVIYFAIHRKTPPPSVGRLLNDSYEPLSQSAAGRYSARFLAAIDRALAVRPEDRPQSISALSADLGLGQAQFDVYATRPLPLDTVMPTPGDSGATVHRTAVAAALERTSPAQPTPFEPQVTAAPARKPMLLWAGAALLALGLLGFLAYSWLAPATAPATVAGNQVAAPGTPSINPEPAPVPLPLPATVPTKLDVAGEFEKVVQASTPGFNVRASTPKATLRIGRDQLSFNVQSDREGFLYVLAHDGADDTMLQLYPNTESGTLRVRAGESLTLPRGSGAIVFNVTEPAGTNRLLVIVSNRQRDHSELDPRPEGAFRGFSIGPDAARVAAAHVGQTPLMAGRAVCASGEACKDEFGAAQITVDIVR